MAAVADGLEEAPAILGVTEMNLTETIQLHGRMKFPTALPSYSVESAGEGGVPPPTHPLVWWPPTRMTPAPSVLLQLSEPFGKGRADGLDKFLFLKQR